MVEDNGSYSDQGSFPSLSEYKCPTNELIVSVGNIRDSLERQGWDAPGSRAFPPHLQPVAVRTPCERMARRHQGQQRSGSFGKYRGLISPDILRLERRLIHKNSLTNFLHLSRKPHTTLVRMWLWSLNQPQPCRIRVLVIHHLMHPKRPSFLTEIHHLDMLSADSHM